MVTEIPHLHDTRGALSLCWDRLCTRIEASEERIDWLIGTTAIGAAAGSIIGALWKKPTEGAIVGGLIGAAVGALTDGS